MIRSITDLDELIPGDAVIVNVSRDGGCPVVFEGFTNMGEISNGILRFLKSTKDLILRLNIEYTSALVNCGMIKAFYSPVYQEPLPNDFFSPNHPEYKEKYKILEEAGLV